MTLYYLSDEEQLKKTANTFGLSQACVSLIIRRVTRPITVHLGSNYIKLPMTKNAVEDCVTNFMREDERTRPENEIALTLTVG